MHTQWKVTIGATAVARSRLNERQPGMNRRLRPLLVRLLMLCVPVAALLTVPVTGNASAARVPANARAAALASLRRLMIGEHATNHALGTPVPGSAGPKQAISTNWSGYADAGSQSYTEVSARWQEPAITCTAGTSLVAFWVGIDGYTSGSVEQDGSLAYCDKGSGPWYYTWWEMYPNAMQVVSSNVKEGDEITASVARNGSSYTLKVTDSTNPGNSFTEHQPCAIKTCANSSAEWIAEDPLNAQGKLYALAKFSAWGVNAASAKSAAKSGTISTFPAYEITMSPHASQVVLARPGPLNQAGTWFRDAWVAAKG